MQLKKRLVYVAFALFVVFAPLPLLGSTSDCHSCVREAYFSTLLQTDKEGPCDICEIGVVNNGAFITSAETILLGRYPVIPVFGAKPVISFRETPYLLVGGRNASIVMDSSMIIKGPLNPLVTALLAPWESDMKDFWARARLAKWQEQQQNARADAADDTVRGIEQLREHPTYRNVVAGFHETLFLVPEDPIAYIYRATAKLALGDAESALGNAEQAQRYYHDAIQDYTEVIDRAPGNTDNTDAYVFRSYAKFRLGILASAVGNAEQAESHYHAAISDCSQAMAFYRKDEAALKTALAVYTDVVRDHKSAIYLREKYAFAYHLRGLGKQALGQHPEAEVDFRKAEVLQMMPESGGTLAPTLGRRTGEGW